MTTGDWSPGRPFGDDYSHDPRSADQRAHEQREVRRQVADLARRSEDGAYRRELLTLLRARRTEARQVHGDAPAGPVGLDEFEAIPSARGYETLVVTGELLIRGEQLDAVGDLLGRYHFVQRPVECLRGRVVRLGNPDLDAARLADIARILRGHGVHASLNHIAPLGPVAKGIGGPEPSAGARPFSAEVGGQMEVGGGVTVAVIDTGISAELRTDDWLKGVPRGGNIDQLDALPSGPNGFLDYGAGHGTFAAGVVQQVAPGADLRVYRALDGDGIGSELDVACAMLQAVGDGARVINLSLGTQTLDDQPPVALQVALEIIGELEEEAGERVLIVAAAGNYGSARPCWPAAFRRVVSVAGLTAGGRPSAWSNRGFWVDCSTVGEGVMSTYVEGTESSEIDPDPDTFGADAWAVWSGTSFAAPQVAGAVARLCHELGTGPQQALGELLRRGRVLPDFGRAVEILPGT